MEWNGRKREKKKGEKRGGGKVEGGEGKEREK